MTKAVEDVLAERRRQIEVEGFDAAHDDRHIRGELALASVCYIVPSADRLDTFRLFWPPTWGKHWWKPAGAHDDITARRRDLVKGLALGLAEIERIDRLLQRKGD